MPGIPNTINSTNPARDVLARTDVREALQRMLVRSMPARTGVDVRAALAVDDVQVTMDEFEVLTANLPNLKAEILWPTDGVRSCDPGVLRAIAAHLLFHARAAENDARGPITEDDLNELFAAIDPFLTDEARQIMTRQAVRFHAEQIAQQAADQRRMAGMFHDTLGLMPTASEDVPAVGA